MIPIKLEIEGLYSYQHKQIIDFTHLTQAGLFGIFGQVGSGKSSILEAISFGLYGESERLNARDNRAYNMMNLKSSRSVIVLEFYNFEDEKYRIYRDFKRNSKRFDDVKRGDAVLYKWRNEQWVPLPHLDIEKIVGLSYANFKRTIIIPQGKFKEFIELGGKDRTQMMQEIFGLDRFDLAESTKEVYQTAKQNYDRLSGQLQGYASLTEEQIKELTEAWKAESAKLKDYTIKYKKENDNFQQLKLLKTDFETLKSKQDELIQLEKNLPFIQEKQKEMEQYERVEKAFSGLLTEEKNAQNKYELKQGSLKKIEEGLTVLQEEYDDVSAKLVQIEPEFQKIEQRKIELFELTLFKQIKTGNRAKDLLLIRQKKGEETIKQEESIFKSKQNKLADLEIKLNQAKKDRIDPVKIMNLDKWFNDFIYIQKIVHETKQNQINLKQDICKLEEEIKGFGFAAMNRWELETEEKRNELQKQKDKIEDDLRHLHVSQQLVQYAYNLQDGESCPLCGSTNHPNLLEGEDITKTIEKLSVEQAELNRIWENLFQKEQLMRIALEKKYLLETEWNKANNKYNLQKEQLEQHRSEFMWSDIEMGNIEQFYQLKEKAIAANKIVEKLEKSYIQEQKEAEQIKTNVEKYREALRKIEIEYAKLESEVYTKKSQIRFLDIDDLTLISLEEVELKIKNTEKHIENIEIEYKKFQQLYQQLSLKLTAFQTEKKTISVEISELKQNIDNIEKELTPLMEKFHLNFKDEIFNILSKKINVEEARKTIQAFVVSHEVIKNNVATLTNKLKLVDFDENKYKEKEKEVAELEQKADEQAIFTTKLSGELERLERDLKEKGNLLLKFEEIDKRLKNIAVLENMFKGAGFVNYVSAVYLKNLCNLANHRFHRLTNNQLSLQLNDNNEFEIIDYLNGGKSRSVKTLSGGQSFQVSLSLALALAENVQSSSKADKSFFFIDEGFGTQDKDSVNIVFETLNSLYKENKIVGIISHVDELKEKIPVSISVVKDEDQGSLVLY